jgi:hypothetical protein
MRFISVGVLGLSMLALPVLSGCTMAQEEGGDGVKTTAQAATGTTTFTMPVLASGNWNADGVHTVGEYQIGHSNEHPVQQVAYFEFNLDPVKGKTLVSASITPIGSTDFNIEVVDAARCPGPCFKVGFPPQGTFSVEDIVSPTSNNNVDIYLSGGDANRNQDLGYAWITNGLHAGMNFGIDTFNPARLQDEIDAGGDVVFWGRDDFDNGESDRSNGTCPDCPGGVENYIWGSTAFTDKMFLTITVQD